MEQSSMSDQLKENRSTYRRKKQQTKLPTNMEDEVNKSQIFSSSSLKDAPPLPIRRVKQHSKQSTSSRNDSELDSSNLSQSNPVFPICDFLCDCAKLDCSCALKKLEKETSSRNELAASICGARKVTDGSDKLDPEECLSNMASVNTKCTPSSRGTHSNKLIFANNSSTNSYPLNSRNNNTPAVNLRDTITQSENSHCSNILTINSNETKNHAKVINPPEGLCEFNKISKVVRGDSVVKKRQTSNKMSSSKLARDQSVDQSLVTHCERLPDIVDICELEDMAQPEPSSAAPCYYEYVQDSEQLENLEKLSNSQPEQSSLAIEKSAFSPLNENAKLNTTKGYQQRTVTKELSCSGIDKPVINSDINSSKQSVRTFQSIMQKSPNENVPVNLKSRDNNANNREVRKEGVSGVVDKYVSNDENSSIKNILSKHREKLDDNSKTGDDDSNEESSCNSSVEFDSEMMKSLLLQYSCGAAPESLDGISKGAYSGDISFYSSLSETSSSVDSHLEPKSLTECSAKPFYQSSAVSSSARKFNEHRESEKEKCETASLTEHTKDKPPIPKPRKSLRNSKSNQGDPLTSKSDFNISEKSVRDGKESSMGTALEVDERLNLWLGTDGKTEVNSSHESGVTEGRNYKKVHQSVDADGQTKPVKLTAAGRKSGVRQTIAHRLSKIRRSLSLERSAALATVDTDKQSSSTAEQDKLDGSQDRTQDDMQERLQDVNSAENCFDTEHKMHRSFSFRSLVNSLTPGGKNINKSSVEASVEDQTPARLHRRTRSTSNMMQNKSENNGNLKSRPSDVGTERPPMIDLPKHFRPIARILSYGFGTDKAITIELTRPPHGPFGFYVTRGSDSNNVFVTRLSDGLPQKFYSGMLGVGDEILEMNGQSVRGMTLDDIDDLLADPDHRKLILKIISRACQQDDL